MNSSHSLQEIDIGSSNDDKMKMKMHIQQLERQIATLLHEKGFI